MHTKIIDRPNRNSKRKWNVLSLFLHKRFFISPKNILYEEMHFFFTPKLKYISICFPINVSAAAATRQCVIAHKR